MDSFGVSANWGGNYVWGLFWGVHQKLIRSEYPTMDIRIIRGRKSYLLGRMAVAYLL
jgi:hypothetical protein